MGRVVILDNGHGGVIGGIYQTAGKRSPKWSKGILYEGMFNRWVVNLIIQELDRREIPYHHISPELTDIALETRKNRADKIYDEDNNTWILSIHANAGEGEGVEGFTTTGVTQSDALGEIVLKNLECDLKEQKMRFDRKDGDRDKEVDYYILREPKAPAFLLECGFMDGKSDYNNLWNRTYLAILVNSLVNSIETIYNE
jgi:N-acetylmuramoyl-L-alanine amidase